MRSAIPMRAGLRWVLMASPWSEWCCTAESTAGSEGPQPGEAATPLRWPRASATLPFTPRQGGVLLRPALEFADRDKSAGAGADEPHVWLYMALEVGQGDSEGGSRLLTGQRDTGDRGEKLGLHVAASSSTSPHLIRPLMPP